MFIINHLAEDSPTTRVKYLVRDGLAFEIRFSIAYVGFVAGSIAEETAIIQAAR